MKTLEASFKVVPSDQWITLKEAVKRGLIKVNGLKSAKLKS